MAPMALAPPGQFEAGRGCAKRLSANGGRWNSWDAPWVNFDFGGSQRPKSPKWPPSRTWLPHNISPALQPDSERFQQGSRTVPAFRGVHFSVTSPLPQRLKPNRFAVGNKMENGYIMRGIGLGSFQYIWKNESKPLALPLCRKGVRIVILHFFKDPAPCIQFFQETSYPNWVSLCFLMKSWGSRTLDHRKSAQSERPNLLVFPLIPKILRATILWKPELLQQPQVPNPKSLQLATSKWTGIGAQIKAGILLLWEEIKSAPNLHILP